MDVFNFGRIIEEFETKTKPCDHFDNIADFDQGLSSGMTAHQSWSSYIEDTVSPKLLEVTCFFACFFFFFFFFCCSEKTGKKVGIGVYLL